MIRALAIAMVVLSGLAQARSDTDELESAYKKLKEAEAKKDPDALIQWVGKTAVLARKVIELPEPADAARVEDWKRQKDYASQVHTYAEYSLYAMALQSADSTKVIALVEDLALLNKDSPYLSRICGPYLAAVNRAAPDKLFDAAVRLPVTGCEEQLMVLADGYLTRQQNDMALQSATTLVELMKTRPRPEGASDADWEKKKTAALGQGYWTQGVVYVNQNKFAEADQTLRIALPLVKGNPRMEAGALFYLGIANYRLGQKSRNKPQIADALKFSEQAAAMPGPFQTPAAGNVKAIRREFSLK